MGCSHCPIIQTRRDRASCAPRRVGVNRTLVITISTITITTSRPWVDASFGQYLVSVWSVFGQCLVSIWSVFGQCLVRVWPVFGRCLVVGIQPHARLEMKQPLVSYPQPRETAESGSHPCKDSLGRRCQCRKGSISSRLGRGGN